MIDRQGVASYTPEFKTMLKLLDRFLDGTTMYRLLHFELIGLLSVAGILGFFGILPFSPIAIALSACFLVAVCVSINRVFAYIWKAPINGESAYITALILALILSPMRSYHDLPLFLWAGILAMASKYILAIKKKHLFNPAAVAVILVSIILGQSASWWVGTAWMLPFVLVCGFLLTKKIQREEMVTTFFLVALGTVGIFAAVKGQDIITLFKQVILDSPLFFFGFVMFTEPLTTPATRTLQLAYGILVGFLFSPQIHLGSLYTRPEIALVLGNIFSYIVNPKQKLLLILKEKIQIGQDTVDFIFTPSEKLVFSPGQYLEWTLPQKKVDSRGHRRYFTIASSPTEDTIHLGIKFYPNGSTFKKTLQELAGKSTISAGQLAGDFTLPKERDKKLVFMAGGIGITPYRSMIKYLLDKKEKRDIVLIYSNKVEGDIAYKDVLKGAEKELGIRTIYTLTDTENMPKDWKGNKGRVDAKMIQKEIPDWKERYFYLSGSHPMVSGFEEELKEMGVEKSHIKKDFFPGYV